MLPLENSGQVVRTIFATKNLMTKPFEINFSQESKNNDCLKKPPGNSPNAFLTITSTTCYYHLLVPFRFKKNSDGGWDLHKNKIQQVRNKSALHL